MNFNDQNSIIMPTQIPEWSEYIVDSEEKVGRVTIGTFQLLVKRDGKDEMISPQASAQNLLHVILQQATIKRFPKGILLLETQIGITGHNAYRSNMMSKLNEFLREDVNNLILTKGCFKKIFIRFPHEDQEMIWCEKNDQNKQI